MEEVLLEDGERFYIIAARFALFPGHLLINSRVHRLTIGDLPQEDMAELERLHLLARRFLLDQYGKATFWENGVVHKHVPHMHLHGWPVAMELPPAELLADSTQLAGVADISAWYAANGFYHYLQGDLGSYIFKPSHALFRFIGPWLTRQSGNPPGVGGGIVRSGTPETTTALVAQWRSWRRAAETPILLPPEGGGDRRDSSGLGEA